MTDTCDFAELPHAEATLLWTMRVWVIGHIRQQDTSDRIADAFRAIGAPGAQDGLESFMWALSRGARRPLDVLCLCRKEVSADERLFLYAVAMIQQDEAAEALARLETLLSDAAAGIALRAAESIADDLVGAGIHLPQLADAAPTRTLH